ncbi:MAG: hypothetical protein ACOYK8_05390 [Alphaproteobacteria bacterium]
MAFAVFSHHVFLQPLANQDVADTLQADVATMPAQIYSSRLVADNNKAPVFWGRLGVVSATDHNLFEQLSLALIASANLCFSANTNIERTSLYLDGIFQQKNAGQSPVLQRLEARLCCYGYVPSVELAALAQEVPQHCLLWQQLNISKRLTIEWHKA